MSLHNPWPLLLHGGHFRDIRSQRLELLNLGKELSVTPHEMLLLHRQNGYDGRYLFKPLFFLLHPNDGLPSLAGVQLISLPMQSLYR